MTGETINVYYVTYSNEGRSEKTPFLLSLQEAIETKDLIKRAGGESVRLFKLVATKSTNGYYYAKTRRRLIPVKIFDPISNEMKLLQ
jgi:hypothetical protein